MATTVGPSTKRRCASSLWGQGSFGARQKGDAHPARLAQSQALQATIQRVAPGSGALMQGQGKAFLQQIIVHTSSQFGHSK
ncbi:hypothetical protein GGI1_02245 [Acidithiobacillus sp. GGI-221]|nr:hypothetical protein GGI1_02245 [Acidithiobacillus sp. GGI-221]